MKQCVGIHGSIGAIRVTVKESRRLCLISIRLTRKSATQNVSGIGSRGPFAELFKPRMESWSDLFKVSIVFIRKEKWELRKGATGSCLIISLVVFQVHRINCVLFRK